MTSRKFTVFIDQVSTVKPQRASKPPSNKAAEEEAGFPSLSATEKENLHPLTGGRIRSCSVVGLKRKSSVLATKHHNPPNAKDSKRGQTLVSSKKRKVTSSSDGEIERSRPRARRVKQTTSQRRSPELASIAEEKDERLVRRSSQSGVNPLCYDLTVSQRVDACAQQDPSISNNHKTKTTTRRVGQTFLTIYSMLPSSHDTRIGLFDRTRSTRSHPFPCRCSRHSRFHACPSLGPRSLPSSPDPIHSGEEANLCCLHFFIADSGISRTQTQPTRYSHI